MASNEGVYAATGSVAEPDAARLVAALVLATVSTTMPGFLVGALSVQISDEFAVSESTYGWGLGSFFLAATAGSIVLGRLVQRIGPRNQITIALLVSAVVQIALAATASSFAAVVAFLVIAGVANAANQTAVNLAITRAAVPRLGLAIAFKQSAMPSASLLCGLAVPTLALTVGWRWAYVSAAVLTMGALVAVRVVVDPQPAYATRGDEVPVSSSRALGLAAVSGVSSPSPPAR